MGNNGDRILSDDNESFVKIMQLNARRDFGDRKRRRR